MIISGRKVRIGNLSRYNFGIMSARGLILGNALKVGGKNMEIRGLNSVLKIATAINYQTTRLNSSSAIKNLLESLGGGDGVRDGLRNRVYFYLKLQEIIEGGGSQEDRQRRLELFLQTASTDILGAGGDK